MFATTTPVLQPYSDKCQANVPKQSTALVVEDHLDLLEVFSLVLKNLGYTVLEATNGKDALFLATTKDIDLLVTDLGLPGIDGVKLVQLVRTLNKYNNDLKIIMLTAYDLTQYPDEALAGCDVVLSKPIDIEKLQRVVDSCSKP